MATSIEDLVPARQRDFGAGSLIVCDRLVRIYIAAGIEVQALQGLDLLVNEGELVALVGASGSGKSTLMNILAGLDTPTAGSVRVAGNDLAAMSARQRLAYRRQVVGFVWQQTSRNLLPYLTAQQNVELPMRLAGGGKAKRQARSAELLDLLGLSDCLHRRPDQMSGGEQQRAAIAAALVNEPKVLLADEPTGELDAANEQLVLAALRELCESFVSTVVVVTHSPAVARALPPTCCASPLACRLLLSTALPVTSFTLPTASSTRPFTCSLFMRHLLIEKSGEALGRLDAMNSRTAPSPRVSAAP